MIRYTAQNNNGDDHVNDFNQLNDEFMNDLDDGGEFSLSSTETGISNGTTTSTACFDCSSLCTCNDERIQSIAFDDDRSDDHQKQQAQQNPSSSFNSMPETRLVGVVPAAVSNNKPGSQRLIRRRENVKTTTTADEDFEEILHRYEFKPNKVPFRRFTLDDIADCASQQTSRGCNTDAFHSKAKQVVGTFSRPVIVDQLRESEIQFEEEMEETIRKLQKMERKLLKEFDDSDYHTSEPSTTTSTRDRQTSKNEKVSSKRRDKEGKFVGNDDSDFISGEPSSSSSPLDAGRLGKGKASKQVKFRDLGTSENSPPLSSSLDRIMGGKVSPIRPLHFGDTTHIHGHIASCADEGWNDAATARLLNPLHRFNNFTSSSSSTIFSSDFNVEGILKSSPSPPLPQQQQRSNCSKTIRRKLPPLTIPKHVRAPASDVDNNDDMQQEHEQSMTGDSAFKAVRNSTHQRQIGDNDNNNEQTIVLMNKIKQEEGHDNLGRSEQSRKSSSRLTNFDFLDSSSQDSKDFVVNSNKRLQKSSTNKPRPRNRANKKDNNKRRISRRRVSADVNLGYEAEIDDVEEHTV